MREASPIGDELRSVTAETAKRHKASWMELGRYLFTIHKEKFYKAWGYLSFETYCRKELHMKEATAAKFLRSYSFLEKEEPAVLKKAFDVTETGAEIPHYESVNLLRLAKENKKMDSGDFAVLREAVLSEAREPKEVRSQVKKILDERMEDIRPGEIKERRRVSVIKRLITVLSAARRELESERLLPPYVLKQITDLAGKLEDQIRELSESNA